MTIICIAHAQLCLHSTSCLDRAGNVQLATGSQHPKIMNNDNRLPACPTGALIDQKHVYNKQWPKVEVKGLTSWTSLQKDTFDLYYIGLSSLKRSKVSFWFP